MKTQFMRVAAALAMVGLAGCHAPHATTTTVPQPAADSGLATAMTKNPAALAWTSALLKAHHLGGMGRGASAPGFRLAATGADLLGAELPVCVSAGNQEFSEVVYNPDAKEFLVTWHDARNDVNYSGNLDVYAQRVSATGGLVGGPIQVTKGPALEYGARVAYNPVAKEYFVVWLDNNRTGMLDVCGQRLSASGGLVGGPTSIANNGGAHKVLGGLAYNPAANQYLVSWTDYGTGFPDLRVRPLDASGAAVAAETVVCDADGEQGVASLAYDPAGGGYMIAWPDSRAGGYDIYARRLAASGAPTSAEIAVAVANDPNVQSMFPQMVYNPVVGEFLVAWGTFDLNANESDVYAQRLSAQAATVGSRITLTDAANYQAYPTVAVNAATGAYMATWSDARLSPDNSSFDLFGQRLTSAGAPDGVPFPVNTASGMQTFAVMAFDGENFLTAWQDDRNAATTGSDIYAQRVANQPVPTATSSPSPAAPTLPGLRDKVSKLVCSCDSQGMLAQLDAAIKATGKGQKPQAVNHLEQFIVFVTRCILKGGISAKEGQQLIAEATALIAGLKK